MTFKQLNEIVKTADEQHITKELQRIGYTDCKTHPVYTHIGLVDLFNGELSETKYYKNKQTGHKLTGSIITGVKGYEQLEFVLININDEQHHFPIDMWIWAKEIER